MTNCRRKRASLLVLAVDSLPAPPPNHCRKRAIMLVFDSSCQPYHNHHASTPVFQPQNHHYKSPKPQIRAFVLNFGVSSLKIVTLLYIYYIIYITCNLVYHTRQTHGCGCGLGTGDLCRTLTHTRTTHTPVPVRVYKPVTGLTNEESLIFGPKKGQRLTAR